MALKKEKNLREIQLAKQTVAKKQHTAKVVATHKKSASDTGSPEVQVALFTDRIIHLTNHLKTNKKDYSTQLGLLKLVGARRRALNYLKASAPERYLTLIKKLELRK